MRIRALSLPRWLAFFVVATQLIACDNYEPAPLAAASSGSIPACEEIETSVEQQINIGNISIETVATGLNVPWDLAFTGDGRMLVTERSGRIRLIDPEGGLRDEPWAEIPVEEKGIVGLMGIAVSPNFAETGHVYVTATYSVAHDTWLKRYLSKAKRALLSPFIPDARFTTKNRVFRLRDEQGYGVEPTILIDNIPADTWHGTSSLAFGPDNMLYITTGDAHEPLLAQNDSSWVGKLLRFQEDGEIPGDNPVKGTAIYAKGFRNSQGLDWGANGNLYATEHGPVGHDELNHIRPGGNYGWPKVMGPSEEIAYHSPILTWFDGIAPSGLAVYDRPSHPWHGNLLVAGLKSKQLRRIVINQDGAEAGVICEQVLLSDSAGRIRAAYMGNDGFVYLTTSNRDYSGIPGIEDDRVLRLHIP